MNKIAIGLCLRYKNDRDTKIDMMMRLGDNVIFMTGNIS